MCSGVGFFRFGTGLSYLVQSLNQKTKIKTQLVEAVQLKDAAFFQTPILFMEPMPGGSKISPKEYEKGIFNSHSDRIWNPARSKYTDTEVQRLREYVINRGGIHLYSDAWKCRKRNERDKKGVAGSPSRASSRLCSE